jgi:hypothetical protein
VFPGTSLSRRRTRVRSLSVAIALAALTLTTLALAAVAPATALATSSCNLGPGGAIHHVVIIQFDNVHSERDNPNVPSDLEQMPALRGFLAGNGTLLTNDHTVLISHTSNGIVSTETGLYPDRDGITVGNSYQYFDPSAPTNGNVGGSDFSSAFKYWTDPVGTGNDTTFNNDTQNSDLTGGNSGKANAPAPWVPFTRAGCDFAGLGAANMELENTSSDLVSAFPGFNFGSLTKNQTNLEGVAIHCSRPGSAGSGVCANGEADNLPTEPTGYSGFKALFGAFQVWPVLAGGAYSAGGTAAPTPIYDVFAPDATNNPATASARGEWAPPSEVDLKAGGASPLSNSQGQAPPDHFSAGTTTTTKLADGSGNSGFPGFNGQEANTALGETAAAQEAGIPVTYTYLSDVHDDHYDVNGGNAFGPGQAGDVEQLKEYNAAFAAFFQRLANEGINKSNTVFLVTVDEGDHFTGGAPTNPGCDGVTTPCTYSNNVGEVDVNLNGLVKGTTNDPTVFDEDFDDAPTVLIAGRPGANAANTRQLEREISGLSEWDPVVDAPTPITDNIADQQEEKILHMQNADPLRLPTFTLFGNDDFFFQDSCVSGANPDPGCWKQNPGFAWNHGDDQPEIASTWQGWVGPDVQNLGVNGNLWTDHPDARPTLLSLLGLSDDYTEDGRAIAQIMSAAGTPAAVLADPTDYDNMSAAYKQLDAPFGEFGRDSLMVSTKAVATSSTGDATYRAWDAQLTACETLRTPLVTRIDALLHGAVFAHRTIDSGSARSLTQQANALITDMHELSGASTPPRGQLCGGAPPKQTKGRGPVGRQAKINCIARVHKHQLQSIACRGVHGSVRDARIVVALSRGKRVVGWGAGLAGRRIAIHHRRRLQRGRYRLTVTVMNGGPRLSKTVRL